MNVLVGHVTYFHTRNLFNVQKNTARFMYVLDVRFQNEKERYKQ